EAEGIDYMVVGSFASAAFGEARFTNDIDIVARLDEARAVKLCAAFPKDEFYLSDRAALEAVRTRRQFNVIHPASGNKVDWSRRLGLEVIWQAILTRMTATDSSAKKP